MLSGTGREGRGSDEQRCPESPCGQAQTFSHWVLTQNWVPKGPTYLLIFLTVTLAPDDQGCRSWRHNVILEVFP